LTVEHTNMRAVSRRQFLAGAGAGALALSLGHFSPTAARARGARAATAATVAVPDYQRWEDVFREKWTWDRIAKGTHYVNCWYQRGCNWNVYVKDGLVFREEQSATYPATNPDVPDFNPRGCQKGACYGQRMYDPDRLKYPLKRVGERGEGKWQRVSWDEALTDIADTMLDVLAEEGPGAIYWDFGTAASNGCHGIGLFRSTTLLDTPFLDANSEIGDHHPGAAVTCGKIGFASSADDCFYSDIILVWGGNPVYTQIPNAHFFTEARYHGARVITIAPDYNASGMHADLWVPVNVGTDAALGLSMAHVIIEEDLYDAAFIREQTDLTLLVRKDNGQFLRQRDMRAGGADDIFYVLDTVTGNAVPAPQRTLDLAGVQPALQGETQVRTLDGAVTVTPVFTLLRERLRQYAPQAAARITGTSADMIRRLARDIAAAKAATILTQSNFSKFYHGVEMERAQILVLALCGHFGKKGSGFNAFPWLTVDSPEALGVARPLSPKLGLVALGLETAPKWLKAKWKGWTNEMFIYNEAREMYKKGGFVSSVLFYYMHGGMKRLYEQAGGWDPTLKRSVDEYVTEALEKGWQIAPKTPPRIFFEEGGNVLRRVRGYGQLIDHLLPQLRLLVTMDWRLSNTAMYSDYILPSAGWYEKDDVTWATPGRHRSLRSPTSPRAPSIRWARAKRSGSTTAFCSRSCSSGRSRAACRSSGTAPARSGGSTGSTTTSPSAAALRRMIRKSCFARSSGWPRISREPPGTASRNRATSATAASAWAWSISATPPTSRRTRRSPPTPGTRSRKCRGRHSHDGCSSTSTTNCTRSWTNSFRFTRTTRRSGATTRFA
jgi:DMSO reductase family type II enzyme molybdopterin subunit